MEPAFVISVVSLGVAVAGLFWSVHTWRMVRKTKVRVMAWHEGGGLDIGAETVSSEQVIALRVSNHGERFEYVMWTGLETPTGDPLADDRPRAPKLVDDPPPAPHEIPPRGQLARDFKLPGEAIGNGFVGYAVLATGERLYSMPARPDPGLADIQSEILQIASEIDTGRES